MKFALFVVVVAFLASPALGRVFTRCRLARELYRLGVPKSELAIWTCIAEHESSYNTAAVGPPNYNRSNDYGIFQINDLYWCSPRSGKFSYNMCHTKCTALTTDDIRNSVKCARKAKSQQGWSAWSTWHFCNGALKSIDNCFRK